MRGGGAPSNLDCYTGGAEGSTRRGVFWVPSRGSWRAEHGGVSLGFFADELDAALAYDVKARALGEPVNFKKYRHDKTVAEERAEQRALVKREHEAANINGASAPASRHEHSASTQRRVLNKVSVLSTAARLLALARKKKRDTCLPACLPVCLPACVM